MSGKVPWVLIAIILCIGTGSLVVIYELSKKSLSFSGFTLIAVGLALWSVKRQLEQTAEA